jgi:hypothetical protein
LSWQPPRDDGGASITGYTVIYRIGGSDPEGQNTNSSATAFTVNGLRSGTTYTFEVEAVNRVGYGQLSGPATVTTSGRVGQSITIYLSKQHVQLGSPVVIYGRVHPSTGPAAVWLERRHDGQWAPTTHSAPVERQRFPSGAQHVGYKLTLRPHRAGEQTIRIVRHADTEHTPGHSQPARIDVQPRNAR